MRYMQFFAIGLMLLLTLTLVLPVPRRIERGTWLSRVRNMFATGLTLLLVHFLLQFHLGLRDVGVTPSVMLNLLFFIPASWMVNMGVLYLQRQRKAYRYEWLVGFDVWMIVIFMMLVTLFRSKGSLLNGSREILWIELFCSVLFAVMQFFYLYQQIRELRRMHQSLNEYYDQDMGDILRWLEVSIIILMVLAAPVPLIIFGPNWFLTIYGVLFFGGVYYLIINFMFFVVSRDFRQVQQAIGVVEEDKADADRHPLLEDQKETVVSTLTEKESKRVESAVLQWLASGGHLHNGITVQTAADEMRIPRHQLTAWLKTTDQKLFSSWVTSQRVEEAKRQMVAHPEWSNDIIAESCGFGSRSYFQTVFRKTTGMTPLQFLENNKE